MSNEAFFKRHGKKPLIFIILILLVILSVVVCVALSNGESNSKGKETGSANRPVTDGQTLPTEQVTPGGETDPQETLTSDVQTEPDDPHTNDDPTVETQEQAPSAPEDDPEETLSVQPTTPPSESETPTDIPAQTDIPQQKDAEYERWLAAAMVVCVSIEYPDFDLEGIWAASATTLEEKYSSDGAYIAFTSGGERIVIQASALENERTQKGTTDISTEVIGFASFDKVKPADFSSTGLDEIKPEELSELISQSLLISIYNH